MDARHIHNVDAVGLDLPPLRVGSICDARQHNALAAFADHHRSSSKAVATVVNLSREFIEEYKCEWTIDGPQYSQNSSFALFQVKLNSLVQEGSYRLAIITKDIMVPDLPCLPVPAEYRTGHWVDERLLGDVATAKSKDRGGEGEMGLRCAVGDAIGQARLVCRDVVWSTVAETSS